jgi:integrase
METKGTIEQALVQLERTVHDYNYKQETKRKYRIAISNLSMYIETCNEADFAEDILETYEATLKSKQYSSLYQKSLLRIVFLVRRYLVTGAIEGARNNCKHKIFISDQNFLFQFEESVKFLDFGAKTSSARVYSQVIRRFCNMLSSEEIVTFSQIDIQTLNKIVQNFAGTHSGSMNQVIRSIRQFLGFLHGKGLCTEFKMDSAVYRVPNRSRTIPGFTKGEVQKLLDCCNRENEMDCRIRAIILIAVTTGLRACDIATLKRQDVDWKNSTIAIQQHKTKKMVSQPLLPETGNAIAKYILFHRGETGTETDELFLQHTRKTVPIQRGAICSQFFRLCIRAGMEKKEGRSFHGLRRSAATWLSEVDMDPHEISLFLGHTSFSSVNKYIATNPEMARCSLGFESIPLKSEVYHG